MSFSSQMLCSPVFYVVLTVLFVVLMLLGIQRKAFVIAGVFKMIASTAFLGIAVAGGAFDSVFGLAILVALFFSWWGDLLLIFHHRTVFLVGLVAFFLGHLGFGGAFLVHGVQYLWSLAGLVVLMAPVVLVLRWLNPHLTDMRMPVYAYMVIITLMVALSIGAVGRGGTLLFPLGAVLFWVSDVFVARERFVHSDQWNRLIGLPLYYGAQILLAYSVALTV